MIDLTMEKPMHSVLFVCAANICRSPMAMGLMLAKLAEQPDQWRVASAGVWAMGGNPPAVNTVYLLQQRGIDIPEHRSQPVSKELLRNFQLILTMEQGQKEALQFAFPEYTGRIFLMSEMIEQRFDIPDPIGGSLQDYETTAQLIEMILEEGFEKIRRLAKEPERA